MHRGMHAWLHCWRRVKLIIDHHSSDIKPSNMLVSTQGQVKLCDFGVSVQVCTSSLVVWTPDYYYLRHPVPLAPHITNKDFHWNQCIHGGELPPSTVTVHLFHWPFLLQPERILGGEYGIHSEIWSLGVSVLEVGYN